MFKIKLYLKDDSYFISLKKYLLSNEQLVQIPKLSAIRLSCEFSVPIQKLP